MEISFNELRTKEVVNVCDGKRLGRVIDIVFCYPEGDIIGIVVFGDKNGFFKPCEEILIEYNNINKIGEDTILVDFKYKHGASREGDKKDKEERREKREDE